MKLSQEVFLLLIIISQATSYIEKDAVQSLPDYNYNGLFYSGYLSVSPVKYFHYIFQESDFNPDRKPLVLWLNGGPGCSSMEGWASENGPMKMDKNGKFQMNEYSWHQAANMLYIESPGGVGFSYIDSEMEYEKVINDDITANENFNALLDFFKKFSSYKGRDFYISGESYAGIYVPMLAYNIIEYNKNKVESEKIKLKGILVGNGVADWNYDATISTYDFIFTHHLTSYENRLDYNKYCLMNETYNSQKCDEIINIIEKDINGINIYDYLRECKTPQNLKSESYSNSKYYQYARWFFKRKKKNNLDLEEDESTTPCFDDTNIQNYFNRKDVQSALHVTAKSTWYVCSGVVSNRYIILPEGSIWTYPTLIKEGIRILIYSGDTDVVVPYNGNQAWIKDLKLEVEEPWRQWRAFNDMNNVSGYIVKYKGLTFCTIKGTGHMTPMWKPKESFYMFQKFINEEDF